MTEYEYLKQFNEKSKHGGRYKIKLVKNFTELQNVLSADETTIAVLLSIEGGHSFNPVVPRLDEILADRFKRHDVNEDLLPLADFEANIAEMKKWEYVPLFVTLTHHFWNGLGGHARSLNKMIGALVSQEEGLNTKLQPLGEEVINRLLSTRNGPRVLIDMKHMSPLCRKDFYAFIRRKYWNKGDIVPIVCSYTGIVSKVKTIDALIQQAQTTDETELNNKRNFLHECSINLCEEDIKLIAESKGLIGLQLDEKRIAGKEAVTRIKKSGDDPTGKRLRMQYVKIICANLFEIAKAVGTRKAWDLPCIGSDYDGLINHLDFYPTTAEMPTLRLDVLQFLKKPVAVDDPAYDYQLSVNEMQRLMFGLSPEEIVDKIFSNNAMDFLEVNFIR